MRHIRTFPNRTWCDVVEEMRQCYKTYNFTPILGLLEELQSFGNRLEAALHDNKDVRNAREVLKEAKEELAKLNAEINAKKDLKHLLKK